MSREGERFQKILDYLKKNLDKGYPLDSLRIALIRQGHNRLEVQRAVNEVEEQRKKWQAQQKLSIKYELLDEEDKVIVSQEKKNSFWKRLLFWKK